MATAIIGTLKHLPKASILPTLPETGRPNRIYFIPNEDPTEDNRYNEYLWVKDETYPDGHWELVGPTTINLTIGDTIVNLFHNIFKIQSICVYPKSSSLCYYADDIVILGESKAHLRNVLVAIKLYLKHVLKLGVKGNYQIFPVESRGIDFVGYAFRHDYIRVRKGIKNSCRKRIRHSNNLAGILPSYFGWFQHCNAVNLKRTILDEVRKIENK